MAKKLIKEIRPYVKLYRDTNNGIAWIEDGSTGLGISVHPNLDKSGSVTGMKKLGYWDKSDRIVLSHGWKSDDSHGQARGVLTTKFSL